MNICAKNRNVSCQDFQDSTLKICCVYTTGAHSFTRARGFRAGEQMAAVIGPVDAACLRTPSCTVLSTKRHKYRHSI